MNRSEKQLKSFLKLTQELESNIFDTELSILEHKETGELGDALSRLGNALQTRQQQLSRLNNITNSINAGVELSEVLDLVFESFRDIIPYNRIGFALLEDNGKRVVSKWARSDVENIRINAGYNLPLASTSLGQVLESSTPRILNDLEKYAKENPLSESTRALLDEGMRSSLTCPLVVADRPAGLLFFSSTKTNTYANAHVAVFQQIAAQLSATVEKSRLVTDLVDNQKALEEKNSELAKLNDLKNTFIGMAAHDLRGPLVQVLWSCEMLFDEDSDISVEDRKTMGSLIQNSCEHMLALIDDLLDVALIETGKLVLDQSPSFLNDLLEASIVAHKPHAQKKSIAIEIAPTDGPVVMVDPRRIRQVLDNLISNAVKYSYPETTVGVSVERVNSGWRVNVRDQGPGLTAEDKRKIFGDFQKLSARPTGGEKSSGLGLAIAKRIVTAHHGEIGADSEQGRGAVFWFTIPDV